jgi:hypothetical protein
LQNHMVFFYGDYYYHKVGNYNIVVNIMVDNQKTIYECVCMRIFWECDFFSNVVEVSVVLLCIVWGTFWYDCRFTRWSIVLSVWG